MRNLLTLAWVFALVVGCGSDGADTPAPSGSGGSSPTGGVKSTGGVPSTGGATPTGGTSATGGAAPAGGVSAGGASGGSAPTVGGSSGGGGGSPGGAGSPMGGSAPMAGSGGKGNAGAGASNGGAGPGGSGGVAGAVTGGASTAAGASGMGSGGAIGGAAVKSAGCDKARTIMDGNQMLSSGGQNRQWHVKAPSGYDQTHPYRVIFMYHWNGGSINSVVNPPDADKNTDRPYYGMQDLSGDSTIFVVPQGLNSGWDNSGGRDSTFTDDMLNAVTAGLCVDTTRIFTTGFSYGGAISIKLACTRPDKFRAALVYDTGSFLSGFNASECKTPIAFFDSHGLDDGIFGYEDEGLKVLGIFTKLNGCTAQTPPKAADNAHLCVSFEGCSAGHPVRFCNFGKGQNNPKAGGPGGHYPSPKDPGETTSWVPAEAWKFLTQF